MAERIRPAVPGYVDEKAAIQKRLRRIEGQIRGLEGMVAGNRYCIDVLDQISATTRALQAVALALVAEHLSHCVAHAVAEGGTTATEMIDEASAAIARLVRA
jgi:DNA-binding FrmR family transcriptional regulator